MTATPTPLVCSSPIDPRRSGFRPRLRRQGYIPATNSSTTTCYVSSKRCGRVPVAYRVEELAAAAGVSVELVRSYQTKGLLDPPRRDGRVALYDDRHLERLHAIKE